MITVVLIDDSPLVLTILKRMLATSSEIEVVGTASNGKEGFDLIAQLKPDVICTDLHMPGMDGLELTKKVMRECPRPILVISVSVHEGEDHYTIFRLLEAGAVDIFAKPRGGLEPDSPEAQKLISKIKILSGVKVFSKFRKPSPIVVPTPTRLHPASSVFQIVVVGASTGGPQALNALFSTLPAHFPVPIICVQHITEGFLQGLIDWLDANCALKLGIAQTGEHPVAGNIYFPQEKTHLEIDELGRFKTSTAPPLNHQRPSATVTMRSVAEYYGASTIGVLLTGMGSDGVPGMQSVFEAKGLTIAQDEASCVIFGMPKAAINLGVVHHVLSPPEIAKMLIEQVSKNFRNVSYD